LIAGETGVGKTPFVRALRALAEVSRGRWLHGECYAEGGAAYSAFDQALGGPGGFADADFAASLPLWIACDLVRLAPSLHAAFACAEGPEGDRIRLFESVVAACEALINTPRNRAPAPAPLMFVIEDVQWADVASLALLRHLARRARAIGLKMLVVLTYREAELAEARGLNDLLLDFTRERLATRIRLEPFNREHTAELLGVMFQQEIPAAFADAIYRETEGNLFYIEEVCKTLIEDGTLSRGDGRWQFPQELCCEALPQSVRLMVEARIAKLSPEAQEILRLAAVMGREFDFETLRRAGDFSEDVLVDALEEAHRAQIVMEVRDPSRRTEQETFRFVHNLTAATLRDSISGMRRRRLHRRVGEVVEALRPDEHATLAYHFSMAGDDSRAARQFRLAGDAAAAAYANSEAVAAYTNALALMPGDTPERFDTLLSRAQMYNALGQRAEQKADVAWLIALSDKLADDARRFEALLAQAEYDLGTEHLYARAPAEAAVQIARRLGDKAREGRALVFCGMDARAHGDVERSRPELEAAAACLRDVGLAADAAACLMTLSLTLADLGEYERALETVFEAVKLSRQAGNKRLEATALRRVAVVLTEQRRFAEGLPYAEAALALHRVVGEPVEECHAQNVLGITKAYLGRGAEAEAHWRTGLPLAEAAESAVAAMYILGNMAYSHFAWRGEYLAAITLLEDQLQRPYLGQNPGVAAEMRFYIAELAFGLGLHERALRIMLDVVTASATLLAQNIVGPAMHTSRMALYGRMLAEAGQPDEARRQLAAAFAAVPAGQAMTKYATALRHWGYGVLTLGDQGQMRQAIEVTENMLLCRGQAAPWNYDVPFAHRLLAELYLAFGDHALALRQAEETLEIQGLRQFGIETVYLTLARALRTAGRPEEAAAAIRSAYQRVLLVAGRTPDPDVQAAWLEQVPANREIIAWWEGINQPDTSPATTPG
ncbi:MAG: ATP-binding protein, partial [Nitrososphaerales archaeon]